MQYIQWSGSSEQSVTVDWALLSSAADADAFAAAIRAGDRAFSGSTGIQSALSFGAGLFANDFDGLKQVADVSGDGECNSGCGDDLFGKTAMVNAGVAVNGLVIGASQSVKNYYTSNVITTGGKLYEANDFADFGATIREKIFAEVGGEVPEPSTWVMLVTGFTALAFSTRRRRV